MAVTDWSTTAGSNTTLGALSTQGTAQANTIDDLFRELMAQVATFNTGATFGHNAQLSIGGNTPRIGAYGTTVATSGLALGAFNTTAGNAAHLDFYRSKNAAIGSADVVASGDNLGAINWFGAQQTGTFATQTMAAQIRAEVDGTVSSGSSGDMPGRLVFSTTADAGSAVTDRVIIDSAGVMKPAANDGAALGKSGTAWSDLFLASGAVVNWAAGDVTWTHSTGIITQASGFLVVGGGGVNPGSGNNLSGTALDANGTIYASRGGQALIINRTTDGTVMLVNSGGTTQGSVSISGATVTWGTFTGAHWSQLASGAAKIDILRGTILETIDEMCDWFALSYVDHVGTPWLHEQDIPEGAKEGDSHVIAYDYEEEGKTKRFTTTATVVRLRNDNLARFKVSDEAGSNAVYGVFGSYDPDFPNDVNIHAIGTDVIRLPAGITPKRGDLIESDGTGCGRIQADNLFRASTVAKISAPIAVGVHPDGSRMWPCTVHCG